MRTRLLLVPALAATALLTLSGCFAGPGGATGPEDGGGGTETDDGGAAGGGTVGDCLQGTWALDAENQLVQLQDHFTSMGLEAQAVLVEGGVTLTVDGEEMTYDSNVTYTMTAGGNGLDLMVVQTQVGQSSGGYTESDGRVEFERWKQGIEVQNTISSDGQTVDMPIEIPADMGTGVGMGVDCAGDTLTTTPEASPFTGTWARVS